MFGEIIGIAIVLLNESTLADDLCLFWNTRATRRTMASGASDVLLIPYRALATKDGMPTLGEWITNNPWNTNLVTLMSTSVGMKGLQELAEKLKPLLPQDTLVDIWYDNFQFIDFHANEKVINQEIRISERRFDFAVPLPDWNEKVKSGVEWVVEVDFQRRSIFGLGNGYIPPKYPGLNYLLAGEPDLRWFGGRSPEYYLRLSHNSLCLY